MYVCLTYLIALRAIFAFIVLYIDLNKLRLYLLL
jgi:hypothetical protein